MAITTAMPTDLALARLFQLVSPSLPIGGYSYSQGIEWAVEAGWINSPQDLHDWLSGLLDGNMRYLEIPVLQRMMNAWQVQDVGAIAEWNEFLLASRETAELRAEEKNRARAFYQVLGSLASDAADYRDLLLGSQHACYSYACVRWQIEFAAAANGLLWAWLENCVLAAVKIIPLGQSSGQQLLFQLADLLPVVVEQASRVDEHDIGASSMALAIASSRHESQYTRLFRS